MATPKKTTVAKAGGKGASKVVRKRAARRAVKPAAKAGVFESLFDCMFSDFERERSMGEVFVSGFFVDRLEPFLQSFTFLLKGCQLIFLSLS